MITLKGILLGLLLMLLSLFHQSYQGGGCWIGSCPTVYSRGYPLGLLSWKVGWPEEVTADRALSWWEVVNYPSSLREFSTTRSMIGFGVGVVFWTVVGVFIVKFESGISKKINPWHLKLLMVVATLIASSTYFLPSWDMSQGLVISRGAPIPYLQKFPITRDPYWWTEKMYFNPFNFAIDGIIAFLVLGLVIIVPPKLLRRF